MRRYSFETFFNAITRLAMLWILFEKTRSTEAIAMLSRAYGMPVMDQQFFTEPQHSYLYKEQP